MRHKALAVSRNMEAMMNEDVFNVSIRKFLKTLGVSAQREIEKAVRQALAEGKLTGNERLQAMAVVTQGSFGAPITQIRVAYMRYVGQGHEIPVPLPARPLGERDVAVIRAAYDTEYIRFYDRPVPGSDVEIMSYAVVVATVPEDAPVVTAAVDDAVLAPDATAARTQLVRDTITGKVSPWSVHDRTALAPGVQIVGPAIIAEDETSTLVGPGWSATVNGLGYLELTRELQGNAN